MLDQGREVQASTMGSEISKVRPDEPVAIQVGGSVAGGLALRVIDKEPTVSVHLCRIAGPDEG
jgi:hypothetical protein